MCVLCHRFLFLELIPAYALDTVVLFDAEDGIEVAPAKRKCTAAFVLTRLLHLLKGFHPLHVPVK